MALRTINDGFFVYRDPEFRLVHALRGETHDIPEGEDLERGDKFGAFTAQVGEEPTPPQGQLIDIRVAWTADDYNRFVDAGTIKEITAKLADVAPENQADVARKLIEAEESRLDRKRVRLIAALTEVADGTVLEAAPVDGEVLDSDGSETPSLEMYVEQSSIAKIKDKVGTDYELAGAIISIEQARPEPRASLVDALTKVVEAQQAAE